MSFDIKYAGDVQITPLRDTGTVNCAEKFLVDCQRGNAPEMKMSSKTSDATKALKQYAELLGELGDKKGAEAQQKRAKEIYEAYLRGPSNEFC